MTKKKGEVGKVASATDKLVPLLPRKRKEKRKREGEEIRGQGQGKRGVGTREIKGVKGRRRMGRSEWLDKGSNLTNLVGGGKKKRAGTGEGKVSKEGQTPEAGQDKLGVMGT